MHFTILAAHGCSVLPGGCFGQLEVLQLGFNRITDIAALGLDRIPELKVLYLHGNEINRIIGLNLCTSLRELVLDKNKIKTIDPGSFVGLSDLRELRLQVISDNQTSLSLLFLRSMCLFVCLGNRKTV